MIVTNDRIEKSDEIAFYHSTIPFKKRLKDQSFSIRMREPIIKINAGYLL